MADDETTCTLCQSTLYLHEPTGLWASSSDVITGSCRENRLTVNESNAGRHIPEEVSR